MKGQVDAFLENLFRNAKHGSLFLFADSVAEKIDGWNWLDTLITRQGLHTISSSNEYPFQIEPDEEKKELEPYYSKFGPPKLQAQVAYRICRKQ